MITDKGTQLMEGLLLNQYANSPNLKEYISAYVSEMDLLFEQIESVYLGRFIENAVGTQLDIIGIILNENRNVPLPTQFFGFNDENLLPSGTANVYRLADEATPSEGGVFKDEGQSGTSNFPLSDIKFRKLLLAKAWLLTHDTINVNDVYHAAAILIGRVPSQFEISIDGPRLVTLNLSSSDTGVVDDALITYFGRYLFPLGTTFNVTRT